MKKFCIMTFAAVCVVLAAAGTVRAAEPDVSAQCAALIDQDTGRMLYARNPDSRCLIASTTKIMTALVVCEQCDPEAKVTVAPQACGIEGSSLYLKPGETLTVRELLYGLMLHSGNDAAVALALACSGDVDAFVAQMNEKACALGLEQTHFANPNGLDDEGNYSTAHDMALLACAAMRNELFAQIVGTKTATIGARSLRNHNKLLWRYDGADGIKTGFTKAAGRIFVSSAVRQGRRLIAVTMNAPDDWNDHARLLDYGFDAFALQTLTARGAIVCELPVAGAAQEGCPLTAAEQIDYPVAANEVVTKRVIAPDFLYAPVRRGQRVGTLELRLNGHTVAQCDLLAGCDVPAAMPEKKSIWQRIFGE